MPEQPSQSRPDGAPMPTQDDLDRAPLTQKLMLALIDRPEIAAAKVRGEVKQLQAGITALFQALTECGIHAARLEHQGAAWKLLAKQNEEIASDALRQRDAARSELQQPTPEQIDRYLDRVLKASGSALKNYTLPMSLLEMRAAILFAIERRYERNSTDG